MNGRQAKVARRAVYGDSEEMRRSQDHKINTKTGQIVSPLRMVYRQAKRNLKRFGSVEGPRPGA